MRKKKQKEKELVWKHLISICVGVLNILKIDEITNEKNILEIKPAEDVKISGDNSFKKREF